MIGPAKMSRGIALLIGIAICGVVVWQGVDSIGLFPSQEAAAMGRSGPPLPDDSLPETLTPDYNRSLQGSSIFFIGVLMSGANKVTMHSSTVVNNIPTLKKPSVWIVVNAPKDRWYIINCVAKGSGAKASLMKSAATPVNVASWDYRNRPPGTHLYPALVELKAGQHFFYWTLEEGSIEFLETHILKAKIEG